MQLRVVDHPLVAHKVSHLRSISTPSPLFRQLVDELVTLLAYEATREVHVEPCDVITPVAPTQGVRIASPKPLVVPILRAGLGMLEGMMRLLPTAEVGFVGMARDEHTLQPVTYAERLPKDLSGRQCFVLDPMLATGGTLCGCFKFLTERGASDVTGVCLLAAPEGIAHVRQQVDDAGITCTLVVAGVDERLNEHGYIVPGLGDAGDRLYGIVD
ncbi:MAG: uracil phosphoribosyltransferase [Micrococcales bacterium]|nr:uracil phosphoribosyltransferase [Micrococcales bacterium]